MKFINVTPHKICLYKQSLCFFDSTGNCFRNTNGTAPVKVFEPAGLPARCSNKMEEEQQYEDVQVIKVGFNHIVNLPEPRKDVMYITSAIVADEAKRIGRKDVVVPFRLVKEYSGRTIGCTAFCSAI